MLIYLKNKKIPMNRDFVKVWLKISLPAFLIVTALNVVVFALGSNFSLFETFLGYGKLILISLPMAALIWLIEKLESKTQQNS
jgi:hypothetical protein